MFRSWRLGRAFGIDLFVHWSFLLIPALALYANLGLGVTAAIGAAGLVVSMMVPCPLRRFGRYSARVDTCRPRDE